MTSVTVGGISITPPALFQSGTAPGPNPSTLQISIR